MGLACSNKLLGKFKKILTVVRDNRHAMVCGIFELLLICHSEPAGIAYGDNLEITGAKQIRKDHIHIFIEISSMKSLLIGP